MDDPLQPVDVRKSRHSTLGSVAPRRAARTPGTIPSIRFLDHLVSAQQQGLFQGDNYIQMFKKREIYRHLTNAAERMSHCASTLHDIVVKMV